MPLWGTNAKIVGRGRGRRRRTLSRSKFSQNPPLTATPITATTSELQKRPRTSTFLQHYGITSPVPFLAMRRPFSGLSAQGSAKQRDRTMSFIPQGVALTNSYVAAPPSRVQCRGLWCKMVDVSRAHGGYELSTVRKLHFAVLPSLGLLNFSDTPETPLGQAIIFSPASYVRSGPKITTEWLGLKKALRATSSAILNARYRRILTAKQ